MDNAQFPKGFNIVPVGSRVTCRPAPTDTDRDYIMLVPKEQWDEVCTDIQNKGWKYGGSRLGRDNELIGTSFASFTFDIENLIVTDDSEFYRKFLAATNVARSFNLLKKSDRIMLFQAVLYGNFEFTLSFPPV